MERLNLEMRNYKKNQNSVENRGCSRACFSSDIFYPIINNKSVYKDYDMNSPLMTSLNISESGICFKSRVPVEEGDFISFMLQMADHPSFWCLSEVKWREKKDEFCLFGSRFYLLSEDYTNTIRKYVAEEKNF